MTLVFWSKSLSVEITSNYGWLLKFRTLDSVKITGHLNFGQVSVQSGQTSDC